MSISMFYSNPLDEDQKKYNMPIMTEAAFKLNVLPAAIRAKAQLIPLLATGLELQLDDVGPFLNELQQTKSYIDVSASPILVETHERVDRLINEINRIFHEFPAAQMYIG